VIAESIVWLRWLFTGRTIFFCQKLRVCAGIIPRKDYPIFRAILGSLDAATYILNYRLGRRECMLRVLEVYVLVEFEIRQQISQVHAFKSPKICFVMQGLAKKLSQVSDVTLPVPANEVSLQAGPYRSPKHVDCQAIVFMSDQQSGSLKIGSCAGQMLLCKLARRVSIDSFVIEDLIADCNAFVADIDSRPGDELYHLVLRFPAERAP
jgi:hypothetical protein